MKDIMDKVHMIKIDEEIKNLKVAASFVEWTFGEIIPELEDIIDGEKQVKHAHIQKKIEGNLDKDVQIKQFLAKHPKVE